MAVNLPLEFDLKDRKPTEDTNGIDLLPHIVRYTQGQDRLEDGQCPLLFGQILYAIQTIDLPEMKWNPLK
jgi:hypothetical protein